MAPPRIPSAQRLAEVEAYIKEHGDLPRRYQGTGGNLARWLLDIERGTVPAPTAVRERVAELRRLHPATGKYAVPVNQRIEELKAFVAQHGRLPRTRANEAPLARWAYRAQRGDSTMPEEQREAIRKIWNDSSLKVKPGRPPAMSNAERIAQLQDFCRRHNRLPRERDRVEGVLSRWMYHALDPGSALTPAERATVTALKADYLGKSARRTPS